MMTYDGRYRLGCEGTLYILIEKFSPDSDFLDAFNQHLKKRLPFDIQSYYRRADGVHPALGSVVIFDGQQSYSFEKKKKTNWPGVKDSLLFKQSLKPCFKLMIVGAEHDTAQLSIMASSLGWEVSVVVSPSNPQVISDFPGAGELLKINAVDFPVEEITANVAIVLMSHNYAKDLDYLYVLRESKPAYIGLLGPSDRREKMLNELIEKYPAVNEGLFDLIFGPAGLNIGAETPQEIALSICSEILSVIRGQQPKSLKDKLGSIHLNTKL
jgi:xanthine/CO dehydrogenase XdhC/CoxF family maturation factor